MPRTRSPTPKIITDFCRLRLKDVLDEHKVVSVSDYLIELLQLMAVPPHGLIGHAHAVPGRRPASTPRRKASAKRSTDSFEPCGEATR